MRILSALVSLLLLPAAVLVAADGPDAVEKLVFTTSNATVTALPTGAVAFRAVGDGMGTATAPLRATYAGKVVLEATCRRPDGIDHPNFTISLGSRGGASVSGGVQLGQGRAWLVETSEKKDLVAKDGAPYVGAADFAVRLELDLAKKMATFRIQDWAIEAPFTVDLAAVDTITLSSWTQGVVVSEVILSADTVKPAK